MGKTGLKRQHTIDKEHRHCTKYEIVLSNTPFGIKRGAREQRPAGAFQRNGTPPKKFLNNPNGVLRKSISNKNKKSIRRKTTGVNTTEKRYTVNSTPFLEGLSHARRERTARTSRGFQKTSGEGWAHLPERSNRRQRQRTPRSSCDLRGYDVVLHGVLPVLRRRPLSYRLSPPLLIPPDLHLRSAPTGRPFF